MKPLLWREAIAESSLDRTAKLIAHTLSTRMNGAGDTFAGKRDVARRASLSERAVDDGVNRLEQAGYLFVERSKGRKPNHYLATVPNPVVAAPFDDSTAQLTTLTPQRTAANPVVAALEFGVKAIESVRPVETDEERRAKAAELRETLREHQLLRSIPQ
jgi:hypothetical protein